MGELSTSFLSSLAFMGTLHRAPTQQMDAQPPPGPSPTVLWAAGGNTLPTVSSSPGKSREEMLAEKDLPDVFQDVVLRVLPACPLCDSTSTRTGWKCRTVVAASILGRASRSFVWCWRELLLLFAPEPGLLFTFLAL